MKQITKFKEFFANGAEDFMPICIPKVIDISYKAKLLEAFNMYSWEEYNFISLFNADLGYMTAMYQYGERIYLWSSYRSLPKAILSYHLAHKTKPNKLYFSHPTMNFDLHAKLNKKSFSFEFIGANQAKITQLFSSKIPALSLKAVQLLSYELWDYSLFNNLINEFLLLRIAKAISPQA